MSPRHRGRSNMVLSGIRVIDLGRFIAGPMCAAMLGDLGADVIRVERIEGGDDRFQYLTGPRGDNGACFLQWNRNKRSLTLDPMAEGARAILHRLIATADVVVANLPREGLVQLGIDYASLTAIRPDIILVHPSAYGALAAIMHRRATGQGQVVATNLLRSALNVSSFLLTEQALTGRDRVASGNRSQSSCPADSVRTRDGWIMLQCVGQVLYKRWARLMGEEHWLTDPRFRTDELRAEHGEILSERTVRWAAERTTAEALEQLAAARIPAAPVLSPQQVLEDPQVRAGGYLAEIEYPGLPRPATLVTPGVELSATPATIRARAPMIGEHTDAILAELGFADGEIADFHRRKIV